MTQPTLLDHGLVGLLGCFMVFAIARQQPKLKAITFDTPTRIAFYWTNSAALWIGAVAVGAVWLVAGRPLADLGLTWRHQQPAVAAAIAIVVVAWILLETWRDAGTPARRVRMLERWRRTCPFMPETRREMRHMNVLAISAGATEEIIFRGYLISYASSYTGTSPAGLAAAVALPALAFTLAHLYHDRRSIVRVLVFAVSMGAVFVVTRSLLLPIVLHAVIDAYAARLGMWVADRVRRERGGAGERSERGE